MLVVILNRPPLQTALRDHEGRLMAESEFINKITGINSLRKKSNDFVQSKTKETAHKEKNKTCRMQETTTKWDDRDRRKEDN